MIQVIDLLLAKQIFKPTISSSLPIYLLFPPFVEPSGRGGNLTLILKHQRFLF